MTKFTIKHQDNGVPPVAVEVKEATTIVLGIVLSHVAEIFEGIVGAVAEHYKIDPKEMMEVVKNHPSVTQIALHNAISDLGYMPPLKEIDAIVEAPKKTKKFKIKKNTIE